MIRANVILAALLFPRAHHSLLAVTRARRVRLRGPARLSGAGTWRLELWARASGFSGMDLEKARRCLRRFLPI